ncbi:uncharacterized protein LOC122050012 [Zingiber officinale]|uniref:uncharacterized protein LOC122050012 n=1 Tax=Zingiber officinale TaxID=94328 RepID=UPI001C4D95F2|nr:uncharacterized protein LOC122050012 [Zingiber officinale]
MVLAPWSFQPSSFLILEIVGARSELSNDLKGADPWGFQLTHIADRLYLLPYQVADLKRSRDYSLVIILLHPLPSTIYELHDPYCRELSWGVLRACGIVRLSVTVARTEGILILKYALQGSRRLWCGSTRSLLIVTPFEEQGIERMIGIAKEDGGLHYFENDDSMERKARIILLMFPTRM